jgi:hypothetical protein
MVEKGHGYQIKRGLERRRWPTPRLRLKPQTMQLAG